MKGPLAAPDQGGGSPYHKPGNQVSQSSPGQFYREKGEVFTIDAAGNGWQVTDSDGSDDTPGEMMFWSIGPMN